MSFVLTAPDLLTSAAGDLANIGSGLQEATAAAAGPTTGVVAAAQDEVSVAVSRLFGTFGQEFQAITTQAAALHDEFVRVLIGSAAAYLSTDLANAEQNLLGAATVPLTGAAAAAAPGDAYVQLFAHTEANLQSLFGAWGANPFPFLRQVIANQIGYLQQIAATLNYTIQNFPAIVANLPATTQAGIQQLLAANPLTFAEQFIATQIGFGQELVTSLGNMATDLVNGFPAFRAGLGVALQAWLAGDYFGAVNDVAQAFGNLFVTGANPGPVALDLAINFPDVTVTAGVSPTLLGPLGDFFNILNIPGQEAQYLTDLIPPSIPRQMSQNFTNVLNKLTIPSISAVAQLDVQLGLPPTANGYLATYFGLPLVFSYAVAGAPLSALNGLATGATAVQQALLAGNPVGAFGALIDTPAFVVDGFLNGEAIMNITIPVPVTVPPNPFISSFTVPIILHLPFDGILVPPHPLTATIDLSAVIPNTTIPVTIFGTPFMGLAPLLINYVPQQLAAAITPTG
ncbi:PE family protein [Mycobacterium sp. Marseille-P9652]|uniref:PE family protein n=1 Tax=Mycobacterium sp. Marseille-P9652 TaxID=2654950 RepID=UPI0012E788E0|nr:PE family protein [Mycobacterium sp. Marseille-P9652]